MIPFLTEVAEFLTAVLVLFAAISIFKKSEMQKAVLYTDLEFDNKRINAAMIELAPEMGAK